MGARSLYITDVVDVDKNGHTRKPFGRIFYTKGKSLVFYAFDLDQHRGLHNAAFQLWGQRGADRNGSVNMAYFIWITTQTVAGSSSLTTLKNSRRSTPSSLLSNPRW